MTTRKRPRSNSDAGNETEPLPKQPRLLDQDPVVLAWSAPSSIMIVTRDVLSNILMHLSSSGRYCLNLTCKDLHGMCQGLKKDPVQPEIIWERDLLLFNDMVRTGSLSMLAWAREFMYTQFRITNHRHRDILNALLQFCGNPAFWVAPDDATNPPPGTIGSFMDLMILRREVSFAVKTVDRNDRRGLSTRAAIFQNPLPDFVVYLFDANYTKRLQLSPGIPRTNRLKLTKGNPVKHIVSFASTAALVYGNLSALRVLMAIPIEHPVVLTNDAFRRANGKDMMLFLLNTAPLYPMERDWPHIIVEGGIGALEVIMARFPNGPTTPDYKSEDIWTYVISMQEDTALVDLFDKWNGESRTVTGDLFMSIISYLQIKSGDIAMPFIRWFFDKRRRLGQPISSLTLPNALVSFILSKSFSVFEWFFREARDMLTCMNELRWATCCFSSHCDTAKRMGLYQTAYEIEYLFECIEGKYSIPDFDRWFLPLDALRIEKNMDINHAIVWRVYRKLCRHIDRDYAKLRWWIVEKQYPVTKDALEKYIIMFLAGQTRIEKRAILGHMNIPESLHYLV